MRQALGLALGSSILAALATATLAGALTLTAATARAYVLPTEYLMRLLAEQRRANRMPKDLSIRLTATIPGLDAPVEERIYLKQPERFHLRQEAQGENPTLYVEREGQRAAGPEDGLEPLTGPSTNLLTVLLAPGGDDLDAASIRMVEALQAVGIDTTTVSLTRIDGKPVYRIGASPHDRSKSFLSLDKETYRPVRYVIVAGDKNDPVRLETRLLDYEAPIARKWFPSIVEEYRDNILIRRAEVTRLAANQNLPDTLFDVPQLAAEAGDSAAIR